MWLNDEQVSDSAIRTYRQSILNTCPNHIVIDNLFNTDKLDELMAVLQQPHNWLTQQHTYAALYVDNEQWQKTNNEDRFVQRDIWQRNGNSAPPNGINNIHANLANEFLSFLRGQTFMSVLTRIFDVSLTDLNVADPAINTNYFRLSATDFVSVHADDSPGREVCMLLYLNKEWNCKAGGELVFAGKDDNPISIAPFYNRCVLFDPSSEGSEHWVKKLNAEYASEYRYNVTSWYWSE